MICSEENFFHMHRTEKLWEKWCRWERNECSSKICDISGTVRSNGLKYISRCSSIFTSGSVSPSIHYSITVNITVIYIVKQCYTVVHLGNWLSYSSFEYISQILSDDNLSASLNYILAAASKFLLVVLSCPHPSQIKTKRLGKRQSQVTFKVNTQFICGQRGQSALRQIWSEDKRQFSLISTLRELLISSHSNYIMIPLRRREKK